MRRSALALLLLAAACGRPGGGFRVGLAEPLSRAAQREAAAAGLLPGPAPAGSPEESAAAIGADGALRLEDFSRLRFLAARAAAAGAPGVTFRLPAPSPLEAHDYPEEWQALTRLARETARWDSVARGAPAPLPFAAPGLLARAWARHGRRYVLLVNASPAPQPLEPGLLAPWRALFEVRADAREVLAPCAQGLCLEPGRALWLEGRLAAL